MTPFQGNKGGGHSLWGGSWGSRRSGWPSGTPRAPTSTPTGLVPGRTERLLGGQLEPPVPPCRAEVGGTRMSKLNT